MAWNPDDPMERRKRIAWAVATSTCIETKKDPVDVYNQILAKWDKSNCCNGLTLDESDESQ